MEFANMLQDLTEFRPLHQAIAQLGLSGCIKKFLSFSLSVFYFILQHKVSTQLGDPLNLPNPLETDWPPPEPINLTVSSTLPPTRPDPFGSASRFPPQKPEPPYLTIKSTKSSKIQRFSDKELFEIHCNPPDLMIFFIFR